MDILFNLGIEEIDIKNMIEQCPVIMEMETLEIEKKIELLKQIGCEDRHIRNILICNPFYLDRLDTDIINLINLLVKNKFECINLLLDSNPFILNKDYFEVEDYINNRLSEGVLLEDMVDELESNPYLFEEI